MKRFFVLILVALAATFGLAACGDDDEGDLAAYCDLVDELDQQEDFPSDDQLDELRDVAPAEIRDEVDLVADRLSEANDDPQDAEQVFDDPEVQEAIGEIEAYEEENCPARDADVEGDDADDTTTTVEDTTTTEPDDDEPTTTVDDDTTTTVDDTTDDDTTETTTVE